MTTLGATNYRGSSNIFHIRCPDKLGHIYALGKTGMGKSTLLLNVALQDLQNGNGFSVLDPHGDLCDELLSEVPIEREDDVIAIDPKKVDQLPCFNPIQGLKEREMYYMASSIVSVFKKLWHDTWGPRLEYLLRNTIHTLCYYPHGTLLDIGPVLTDQHYRIQVLQYVTNTNLQRFWEKEYNVLSPQQRNEFISPILNKIGILTHHPIISKILGNEYSSFEFQDVMDNKKVLLANLSKGILGEEGTQFLGALLVTLFQVTAMRRANIPYADRTPFYLYVDEMHSFVTLSFADILSEARKYGLGLFLTHQFLDQIHEDIRKAILGNVGTIICFRLGSNDAEIMEKEFFPVFTKEDFVSLPQFHIYLKLLIDGTVSQGFSARILSRNELPNSKHLNKKEHLDGN